MGDDPQSSSPSPYAPRNPGLVDVVHRDSGNLGLHAGQLAAAADWRDACRLLFVLVAYLLAGVLASRPGESISPRTTVTPFPMALQWSERASIQKQ